MVERGWGDGAFAFSLRRSFNPIKRFNYIPTQVQIKFCMNCKVKTVWKSVQGSKLRKQLRDPCQGLFRIKHQDEYFSKNHLLLLTRA